MLLSKHRHFEDNVMKVIRLRVYWRLGYRGSEKYRVCVCRFGFPDVAVTYSCPR